ncbi:T9SS type A sorting domain-containing protein [Bacteroidota bacterium]
MNKHFLQLRGFRILLSTVLLFLFFVMTSENTWSQTTFTYPQVPRLSLCGAHDGYNTDWYPDGRIWLPVTQRDGAPREFLMPVFIDNKWWHYKSTALTKFLVPDPIYSFRFKILYDGVAITPVDILTAHPFPEDDSRATNIRGDYTPPLARDFNITWNVHNDMSYREYFLEDGDPPIPTRDREKGRVIVISATGTKPLPVTDTAAVDFNVLLYVKFRINLERGSIGPDEVPSQYSPIYISPDSIIYNDWNVREDIAFKNLLYSDSLTIRDYYPDPKADVAYVVGMAGMNNKLISSLWNQEPILPGTIYLKLTDKLPRIWYDISRAGSQPPVWDNINNPGLADKGMWIVRDPLTVDSGKVHKPDYVDGRVKFTLRNSTSESRLVDVYVESDAPWLTFEVQSPDRSKFVQEDPTKAYIYYLDNAILGEGGDKPDPIGGLTDPDAIIEITIKCDPDLVIPHDGEKAGVYTGYITFRSHTAEISPVRMQVTFINFRNPFEPDDGTIVGGGGFRKQHRGIALTLRNSRGLTGDETKLVFGTGHRATESFDSLYGEFPYSGALSGFGARWYHPDEQFRNEQGMPFGFGDMLPNRVTPYSESRDIRDINDTNFSHIYLCRFDAEGAQNYPVVIEWDTTDFPEGAQLFIGDTLKGALFPSVNMRKSTHVYGNVLSYAIQDPKITSFKIEYTQPKVIDYIDAYGIPKIKKGWNMLSLPVRPKNLSWNVVYPNAINKPFYFFSTGGFLNEEVLRPGVGYFMKYSDKVDTKFKGVPMKRITKEVDDDGFGDEIKIFPGWNTIGALTFPMNSQYIAFDEFEGPKPSPSFVRKHGIWGYNTNEGYFEGSILEPGMGYWIKSDVGQHGYLRLIHPEITRIDDNVNYAKLNTLNNSTRFLIRDNAQHETNLYLTNDKNVDVSYYELPPLPPNELFDARFYTNTMLESTNSTVIKLQGVDYPVSIAVNDADANYTFIDAYTGEVLGKILKGDSRNIEIKSTASNSIKILKSDVVEGGLSINNYPNPVAVTSTVNYSVPNDGFVSLKLYDAIGNAVTLFEGVKTAGEYSVTLDASMLASGSYLCKLTSGSNSTTAMITVVK